MKPHQAGLSEIALFLLRAVSGFLLLQSGGMKILGWLGGIPGGPPVAWTQVWIGGWIELVAGALVMIGLLTRQAAFLLSGTMAVAYWQFHAPNGTWPAQNGGVAAAVLCFVFLYLAVRGGGKFSLDAKLAESKA